MNDHQAVSLLPTPVELPRPFIFLDAITFFDQGRISGARRFQQAPFWQGLEAVASLACFHQRLTNHFQRHFFLLAVEWFDMAESLDGAFVLEALLLQPTRNVAAYQISLTSDAQTLSGQIQVTARDYDQTFREDVLKNYYQSVAERLCGKS